jgi:hypothetical protein
VRAGALVQATVVAVQDRNQPRESCGGSA